MVRAKDLKPIQSKQEYELAAKMALAKHHGTAGKVIVLITTSLMFKIFQASLPLF